MVFSQTDVSGYAFETMHVLIRINNFKILKTQNYMRHFISLLLVLIGLATITNGQQQSSKTPQEQIIDLEKSFAEAIKTQDTLQTKKFQADTYFLAYAVQGMPTIQIVPKQGWLTLLKDYVTESFTIDDIKVNVYDNTAIAMLIYTQKATVRGQDRSGQFVLTDIWYKGNKGWLIAERHSSRPGPPVNKQPK
jgi:ketosteroid isomerase-like protein